MIKFFQKKRNQKGFTLIELLVVISIIGVLAMVAIPQYQNSQATSRGAKIVADLRTIDSAIVQAQAAGWKTTDITSTNLSEADGGFLAAWPVPPTGKVVFAGGKTIADQTTAAYTIAETPASSGIFRATLNNATVEEITKETTTTTPTTGD